MVLFIFYFTVPCNISMKAIFVIKKTVIELFFQVHVISEEESLHLLPLGYKTQMFLLSCNF